MDTATARALPGRIEQLLDAMFESADATVSAQADELVGSLLSLYGSGLERVVAMLDDATLQRLAGDELVSHLLLLHGLHPVDMDTRIQRALDGVRPYLGSHAGGIAYLGVTEGVARLRLEGSCDHCPSSSVTVNLTIEQAVLDAAPEIDRVEVENVAAPSSAHGLPLLQIRPLPPRDQSAIPTVGTRWHKVQLDLDVPITTLELDGAGIVVVALESGPVAYLDGCPRCSSRLSSGELTGAELVCPGCGARYDVHLAGRDTSGSAMLDPVPLLQAEHGWRIAVPRLAA